AAGVAQLVEHWLPKPRVAGSSPVSRFKSLQIFRDEYVPHTRTTIAAEALPDGKTYYRQKIREFTTLDLSPDEIHQIGVSEVAKLHPQMVDAMHESGFKGECAAFLQVLRDAPRSCDKS